MARPRALITGITGQDGSYLAELLVAADYEVVGVVRPESTTSHANLADVSQAVDLVSLDLLDSDAAARVVTEVGAGEVYHLASASFVPASWERSVETAQFGAVTTAAVLEAARALDPSPRVFLAASAAVFGEPVDSPQSEATRIAPTTPYGAGKAFGLHLGAAMRGRYDQYVVSGILYNHESPRRPAQFVSRKITRAAAAISLGLESALVLGSLDARRDWGHARDVVRAMWLSLRPDEPDDYVVATGVSRSVRDLLACAFARVDLDYRQYVRSDPSLVRQETGLLVGDASRARKRLGWEPEISFEQLIHSMVDADVDDLGADSSP